MPRNSTVFFAVLLLPLSIIAGCSRNDGPINNFHPYGIKHAALHLEYFGDTRGTEDLFFDNFGDQETHIKHSETVTDKEFHPKYTVSVRNIANIIAVDSVKMETVRLIDKTFDSLYHLSPGDVPTPEEQFASFFGGRGYIKCGDTLIRVQGLALNAHIWQQGKAPQEARLLGLPIDDKRCGRGGGPDPGSFLAGISQRGFVPWRFSFFYLAISGCGEYRADEAPSPQEGSAAIVAG
jgi:hypothetical protein